VDVGGRYYCFTNNRWVTQQISYGVQSENNSNNCGTGTEPALSWQHMGAYLPKGATLQSLDGVLRRSFSEVTGFDLRVYLQHGPASGDWEADGDTTRLPVADLLGEPLSAGFNTLALGLGDTVMPEDGFVMVYLRPVGSITATRYLYGSVVLSYLTAL
jgi:hypothetical protein